MTPADKLRQKIANAHLENDMEFCELINEAMDFCQLKNKDVAHECSVSIPTIERWKNGKNCPHPIMRPLVFKILDKFIK